MKLVYTKCVDFGSSFCPCIRAEMGTCKVCSQVRGETFCDCGASEGICILEELKRNGGKAKPMRKTIRSRVTELMMTEQCLFIRCEVPHNLEMDLKRPGAFVFIRCDEETIFNLPISVQYEENATGSIGMSIIPCGVKSRRMLNIKIGDEIWLKGPYFSGTLGLRELELQRANRCLVLTKGIATMPSISVIRYLQEKGNNVKIIADKASFDNEILKVNLNLYELEYENLPLVDDTGLTEIVKSRINEELSNGTRYIHIGASLYVIRLITSYLRSIGRDDVLLSCCNNDKMSCGEGICGSCTAVTSKKEVIHFCKEQPDIYNL